ncbi:MAG TPA: hypothetical protein VM534_08230, partial [Thermoanaerobaculia bacterium]|nr:hypothetical protein [Thermoanaerobaculia bacterium]
MKAWSVVRALLVDLVTGKKRSVKAPGKSESVPPVSRDLRSVPVISSPADSADQRADVLPVEAAAATPQPAPVEQPISIAATVPALPDLDEERLAQAREEARVAFERLLDLTGKCDPAGCDCPPCGCGKREPCLCPQSLWWASWVPASNDLNRTLRRLHSLASPECAG